MLRGFHYVKLYMILRIPYQYLPVLQHLLVTHLLQFPRMQFLLQYYEYFITLYAFHFNLYKHYLFTGISLCLIIVSGCIFRILMAGRKQDQRYIWDKTVMRPLRAGKGDWNIKLKGRVPRQRAGRSEHVNTLEERASRTHNTMGRAQEIQPEPPTKGSETLS